MKAFAFSGLFARSRNVPHCGHFSLFLSPNTFFISFSPLFHSFTLSTVPRPPFSVLLSHWDDSHVLWRPSEMKPHIGAVAGGRRRRRRLQKKLGQRSQPRHQPETKLDVVKLSNYLRKLQQNLRRRKTERERRGFFFIVLQNKQSKMVFVKEFMILKSCQRRGLAGREHIVSISYSIHFPLLFFQSYFFLDKNWSRIRIAFFIICFAKYLQFG